jgi:glycosyltransferase involved in cell wall biosynthesis
MIRSLAIGGAQRHLLKTVQHIDRTRFHISVLVLVREDADDLIDEIRAENASVFFSPFPKNSVSGISFWIRLLRDIKPDILQTYLWRADAVGSLTGLFAGVRNIICSERGDRCGERAFIWGRLTRLFDRIVTFRVAGLFVANSIFGARRLASLSCPARKIRVIHNGIKSSSQQLNDDRAEAGGGLTVGIVSRLAPFKDLNNFLRAAAIVASSRPMVEFRIVGDGAERERLECLASEFGLREQVTFTGSLNDPTDEIRQFDVCVLSSNARGNELFPNVLLEYMVCGKPVVATDVGAVRELVFESSVGIVIPPESPRDMAEAILSLLNDEGLRSRIGGNAARHAFRHFDIADRVREYESLYASQVVLSVAHSPEVPGVDSQRGRIGPC